jgi:site-specific DNA recombinase
VCSVRSGPWPSSITTETANRYVRGCSRVGCQIQLRGIICYYRCPGTDGYRYENGPVCQNKPVRADYLDQVIWDHVTALLASPALIRAEISKRTEQARTSDAVTRQRGQLELALTKATISITALITAYSEQLITIDELRTRLPDLRAREANLRAQLTALDTQAADHDAYLKLADNLETFLARLRASTATATATATEDRQRVLRAVVKDILIGPEKITIRHRIHVRQHTASGHSQNNTTDTESDMRDSSLLRSGRDHSGLRETLRTLRHTGPT